MSLFSLFYGNRMNKKAVNAANAGNNQAMGTIGDYYQESKGFLDPYRQTGTQANTQQGNLLNGDYSGFYNSPDFQARMQAGGQMFDSSAAARGGVFGGGATRGREMYAQGLAQQGLGDYRNWLGNVAGQGLNAASNTGAFGAAAGNSIAGLQSDNGMNRASGYTQKAQNWNNFENSFAKMFGGK